MKAILTWTEKILRLNIVLWLLFLSGCFYIGKDDYDDLVKRSPDTWSTRDCLTIVMAATRNNYNDPRSPNIKVVATVYSPTVIMANYRRAHILGRHQKPLPPSEVPPIESTESIADLQYVSSLDILMQEEVGLYYDWQTDRYVDSRGNYVKSYTQVDSLTFFLSIENWGWPLYMPDISNLENEIYLVNDQSRFVRPLLVWGRRHSELVMPENLIVKFRVRKGDYHFLEHSDHMRLLVDGLDSKVTLDFPVAVLR